MKLSKNLSKVTPFSKNLALFLFFLLPILAFFLGMYYQRAMSFEAELHFKMTSRKNEKMEKYAKEGEHKPEDATEAGERLPMKPAMKKY